MFKLNWSTNLTNSRQPVDQFLDNIKGAVIFKHNAKKPQIKNPNPKSKTHSQITRIPPY